MPNFNTVFSYSLRCLVVAHLVCLCILLSIHHPVNPSSATTVGVIFDVAMGLICILLVLDWATKKDPSRGRSKLVDTVLGVVWILLMGALVVYSLSMGTV
jgi:hypothetical protein